MSEEKSLKDKLKEAGLNAAEEYTELSFKQVKLIGKILVEDSSNPYDDMAYKGLLMLEDEFKKLMNKISSHDGD